ncbi:MULTISPECIES: HepT-like ribonuclease domain-containing protein [unclassified Methylobacterium]|jgi:uncharacterized protein with HEPN domain|uniref:HepT-like ribonuclease domain-containing protein n=1 Tax=unclassified Methylobacterium TaxID=2615210 RepID=UPI0013552FF5|nr:HepT-like ribonuclease domain-containing protein [Methylobacterium sp. 2A]MWV20859.1 DUF86 domain-containing protein [Methylobacterium sp. 2A]
MPFSPSERERTACADIIANAERAARFVAGFTLETFGADERTHFAVVRCLEIVSEASRRLSAETKARYPDVPWRQIADAGNVYRHSYHRVTLDIVWLTVHHELPVLVAACRAELARAPDP